MALLINIVVMLVSGIKENLCCGNTLYALRAKVKSEYDMLIAQCTKVRT